MKFSSTLFLAIASLAVAAPAPKASATDLNTLGSPIGSTLGSVTENTAKGNGDGNGNLSGNEAEIEDNKLVDANGPLVAVTPVVNA